ncbi:hypothetical protein [Acidovorax sp. SUPP3334]|uniref:hypothetical protein n=1 Tax=Acidovorax sp. SUPP3334 TaxID=2920881 RepID=UPI0023DE47B2|nr:hypothetical protein [Acidovorax sp. SUPP3334]GKT22629.1 hypothetical protein AVHM3334_09035 [Acidovorax sp. SUPP3334]
MALKHSAIAALWIAFPLCPSLAQESKPHTPARKLWSIAAVASIDITRAAAQSAAGETAPCAGIRPLGERDVRQFLGHARPIDRRAYLHDHFLTGDCYTEARVRFKDGRVATLGIANDAGTAVLTPVVRGKEQAPGRYLHCAQCTGLLDLADRELPK